MKPLMIYAQVFAWLSIPLVCMDFLKALRTILVEVIFLLICVTWVTLSPLIALFGMFYPNALLKFLKWTRTNS